MNRPAFVRGGLPLLVAASLALIPVACGDDGGGQSPAEAGVGTVRGTVVDGGGSGVAGATLTLTRSGFEAKTATSDGSGTYVFTAVAEGSWFLSITPPAGFELAAGESFPRSVTVEANATHTVDVQLSELAPEPTTGSIAGTVTVSGNPSEGVSGATIAIDGPGGARQRNTTPSGSYSFDDLQPGTYAVTITPPTGFSLPEGQSGSRQAAVVAGETATVNFSLEQEAPTSVVEIHLVNFRFDQSSVTIAPGTTVRWINDTNTFHTVTPDGHGEWARWTTDTQGQTFEHTFDNTGTFPYFCEPHRSSGMTGTIVVQ